MKKEMITFTKENIHALFNFGSPNAKQKATLNLKSYKSGWINKLVGTQISAALYEELISCKGRKPKGLSKKEWRKPCEPCEE